jgi:serine protease Do
VRVEPRDEEPVKVSNRRDSSEPAKADRLGLSVRSLDADERKNAETQGYLLVEDVTGAAERAGVKPGDVILGVNGKPVKSLAELKSATENGNTVAILLDRDGQQVFLPIRVS